MEEPTLIMRVSGKVSVILMVTEAIEIIFPVQIYPSQISDDVVKKL